MLFDHIFPRKIITHFFFCHLILVIIIVLGSEHVNVSFLETWRFLHDIYDGGPVFLIEGEKENEEEKQDQREQEEEIHQK